MERVTPNVYVDIECIGCNPGFLVTREGVVMIDTPFLPTDCVRWREEIARHGPLLYLINTEHHRDHILGNFFFKTPVISQEGSLPPFEETALGSPDAETYVGLPIRQVVERMDPKGLPLIRDYKPRPPTLTFSKKMTLHLALGVFTPKEGLVEEIDLTR
jgi:glyoxylase-like metal-dependent hydrolase (beta-lactamase superfamily II)